MPHPYTAAKLSPEDLIRDLAREVRTYHDDVIGHIAECRGCRVHVEELRATVQGVPGQETAAPGLVGEVASLKQSRCTFRRALAATWAGVITVGGWLLSVAWSR